MLGTNSNEHLTPTKGSMSLQEVVPWFAIRLPWFSAKSSRVIYATRSGGGELDLGNVMVTILRSLMGSKAFKNAKKNPWDPLGLCNLRLH